MLPRPPKEMDHACAGATLVEFASSVGVFISLVVGIVQFAWAGYCYVTLNFVAQRTTRWAELGYVLPNSSPPPAALSREDSVAAEASLIAAEYALTLGPGSVGVCRIAPTAADPANCVPNSVGASGDLFLLTIRAPFTLFVPHTMQVTAVGRNE